MWVAQRPAARSPTPRKAPGPRSAPVRADCRRCTDDAETWSVLRIDRQGEREADGNAITRALLPKGLTWQGKTLYYQPYCDEDGVGASCGVPACMVNRALARKAPTLRYFRRRAVHGLCVHSVEFATPLPVARPANPDRAPHAMRCRLRRGRRRPPDNLGAAYSRSHSFSHLQPRGTTGESPRSFRAGSKTRVRARLELRSVAAAIRLGVRTWPA